MSRDVAGVGRCAWLAGRLAASICGEVSLDQSGACEVAIRYMSLRPAPWKKCCSGPPKPPCPWLNCPREEPPPPSAWIRSVLLDLWLAAAGVARWRWGTENSPAETLLLVRAEVTDSQLGGGTVQCRPVPCRSFVSVRTCRCLRSSPTDDRAHPSVSTPRARCRGSRTPLHSTLISTSSFFCYSPTHESRKEWSCYCKYPWRALSVVRSSSSPTPTC